MLVTNPITFVLYEYGYKGIDNIFEYWVANKGELIDYIRDKHPDLLNDSKWLEEFEMKVRWGSPLGVLIRFEIRKMFRKVKEGTIIDFKDLRIRYGKYVYSLDDFRDLYPFNRNNDSKMTDLRGISILKNNIKNLSIQNVDLSYASLDDTTFTNINFSNCILDHIRFCNAELVDCTFDNQCSLNYVDFSSAYLRSVFDAPIVEPVITKLRKSDVIDIVKGRNTRFRTFTEVWGISFFRRSQMSEEDIDRYIRRLQTILEKAYDVKNANLLMRNVFALQLLFKPLRL